MKNENLKKSLDTIKDYISGMKELKGGPDLELVKTQLRVMEKTIKQFAKIGIQVPESLLSEKALLESKITAISKGPHDLSLLYEDLLDIILLIAPILKTWPARDVRARIQQRRKGELQGEILRDKIIAVLREMGGTGYERDVVKEMGDTLKDKFTPSDIEAPHGKRPRWEMNARKERTRMIKEGILTPESKKKRWSLTTMKYESLTPHNQNKM